MFIENAFWSAVSSPVNLFSVEKQLVYRWNLLETRLTDMLCCPASCNKPIQYRPV